VDPAGDSRPGGRALERGRGVTASAQGLWRSSSHPTSAAPKETGSSCGRARTPPVSERPERWAGIDAGARVLAAVAVEGDPVVRLYRSREAWQEFLYWSRRIAEEQSHLACLGLRTSRQLQMLCRRRSLHLRHALQAIAAVARALRRAA
jgi:transposase